MVEITPEGWGRVHVLLLHAQGVALERVEAVAQSVLRGGPGRFRITTGVLGDAEIDPGLFDAVGIFHPGNELSEELVGTVNHTRVVHVLADDRVFRKRPHGLEEEADPPNQVGIAGLEAILEILMNDK